MSTNPLAPYDIYLASPKFKLALVIKIAEILFIVH
jgi:hypothetical protein